MSKQPETRLQRRIRKRLEKEVGGYWIKIHSGPFQRAGFPDLLGCVKGMFCALEVKVLGEDPSDIQNYVMGKIRSAKGCTGVVTSPDEAVKLVKSKLKIK